MKKVEFKSAKPYDPPKHFGMTALKLHGKEETGTQQYWMGLSHFLPNGGAEMDATPAEKLYFVLDGEVTVTTPENETYVLKSWDSLYVGPNEARAIVNNTNRPASMLVIITYK
ncbi:MAG: cupin domain-containing protein [Acidobacteria bacterium]|nr:cupin domain-containing protein [Acidobacteriota bacterium]